MERHHFLAGVLLTVFLALPVQGAPIDEARTDGLKYLIQTQKGDGSFSGLQGLDTQSTAATVEAMIAGGMSKSPQFGRALSWLANAPGASTDSRAWQAAALAAAGRDATAIAGALRDERNTLAIMSGAIPVSGALWGPFPGYAASLPDTALAYGALRSAGVTYTNDTSERTGTALCYILGAQLTAAPWSGSWPYALPQTGQPSHAIYGSLPATAMTLFELKKQRQAGRFPSGSACSRSSPSAIDAGMASAKTWLIGQANADGGFAERNPQSGALEASSPAATALAVRALAVFAAEGDAAATTAVANARNWLVGQQNADGSWRGDPFVTARVLAALPAVGGAQSTDTDNDGLPDVVEQSLGSQTTVADAQNGLSSNGNAQPGITATSFSTASTVGDAFAYTLAATGGTGPFTYRLTGGSLPPGLTLAADGQITGAPTGSGSYAFDYEITDANGETTIVIGRIDIADPLAGDSGNGDVPIPAWALVALGGALLGAIRRRKTC